MATGLSEGLVTIIVIAVIFLVLALLSLAAFIVFKVSPLKQSTLATLITKVAAPVALAALLVISISISAAIYEPQARFGINEYVIGWKDPALTPGRASVTAEGDELAEMILLEGAVLAENKGNLLPLKSANVTNVNVFGWSSVSMVMAGSGSGRSKQNSQNAALPNPEPPYTGTPRWSNYTTSGDGMFYPEIDLYGALTKYGIGYNEDLRDFYLDNAPWGTTLGDNVAQRSFFTQGGNKGTLHSHDWQYNRLYEPTVEQYDGLFDSAKAFSNTAIVFISRAGGESNDQPKHQFKGVSPGNGTPSDPDRHYLEISTEEEALLTKVGQDYPGRTIVIINSTNTMELGFMNTIPGLASCLIIGNPGPRAATAIPKLLFDKVTYLKEVEDWEDGTVNNASRWEEVTESGVAPSGRVVDTYAYDLKTNPVWATIGHPEGSYIGTAHADGSGEKYYDLAGDDTPVGTVTNAGSAGNLLYPLAITSGNFNSGTGGSDGRYAGLAYIDYMESIYVGYKWYETADKMGYWENKTSPKAGTGKTGYDAVVQYPFGYGKSYTDFSWRISNSGIFQEKDDNGSPIKLNRTALQKDDKVFVEVIVSNTGNVAGKEVVQLYFDPPYTPGGVEKASANLVAFAKTEIIEPDKSQVLTLEFDAFDMASYDAYNKSGKVGENGGYILESGNYEIKVMDNAHAIGKGMDTAVAATVTLSVDAGIVYDKDPVSGNTIENRFTGANAVDGVPLDGSEESTPIQYMTRADGFKAFFPTTQVQRTLTQDVRAQNRVTHNDDYFTAWNAAAENQPATTPITGQDNSLKIGTATTNNNDDATITNEGLELGNPENYEDPRWMELVQKLTPAEMIAFLCQDGTNNKGQGKLGIPTVRTTDGPSQYGGFSGSHQGTAFPNATTLAQTYNVVLAYRMGLQIGNDSNSANRANAGWLAPGINIHRSPFGSRNYEYFSEDGFLTGAMAAKVIQGCNNRGIPVYIKHLVLYDQDTNRDGLYTWVTEQALREIYLKPFRIAIQKGGATGLMTAYNRFGATWGGASKALQVNVIKEEMGFKGTIVTDWSDWQGYMDPSHSIRNGGDLFMNGNGVPFESYDTSGAGASNPAFIAQLQRATKSVAYTWANAKWTMDDYNARTNYGENDPDNTASIFTADGVPELNFDWIAFIVQPLIYILLLGGGLTLVFFAFKVEILKLLGKNKDDEPVGESAED